MAIQTVFKRCEMKYMITPAQREFIVAEMEPYMTPDLYGKTTVRNIYYDTDTYLLVRRSIEKPVYKEKLRIRSYEQANPDSIVFVELKKKYKSTVYKRRISLHETEAMQWISGIQSCSNHTQISDEIDYFLNYYNPLHPTVFLSYKREAFYAKDGSNFRITFDDTILSRTEDLSLQSELYGTPILPDDMVLMELKCSGSIPLWMTQILSQNHIYKTSFSKYGTAYQTTIFPHLFEEAAKTKTSYIKSKIIVV